MRSFSQGLALTNTSIGFRYLRLIKTLACMLLLCSCSAQKAAAQQKVKSSDGYVGSTACAKCHPSIYESFSHTDMGRSMSEITPDALKHIADSASVSAPNLNRHFELLLRDGKLYQSEFAINSDGKTIFRETRKLDFLIGAGANGIGGIVKQGDYLFEAPLSFYTKPGKWALSPGYEFGDYGFNRPILAACIVCHSGRPQITNSESAKLQQPPFAELAIGCENCHGPGEAHIVAAEMGSPSSIVNPAKLSSWLSNNICMSCHQTGDARVLKSGKSYRDFRPGQNLEETLSIFVVPFDRASAPKDDLLEHYLSMRLSKCYLGSSGKLSCINCHDPHVQPSAGQAPQYFRLKCLACHSEKSCAIPLTLRQRKTPPDDCAGCHMPKRDVAVISHSVLTNHRIVAQAEEPFPDVAFHLTTNQLSDLVNLTSDPSRTATPTPLTQLYAYAQVVLRHPEYRPRYWSLANQLRASHPNDVYVLEALADEALQKHTDEGTTLALDYLHNAILQGATNPVDFEELATLLAAAKRNSEALDVLQQGVQLAPYDTELYRLRVKILLGLDRLREACEVAAAGQQISPQDDGLRQILTRCAADNQTKPRD